MFCEHVIYTLEHEHATHVVQHIMVSTWNSVVSTRSMVSDFCTKLSSIQPETERTGVFLLKEKTRFKTTLDD